jgi:hypothetical protein
MFEEDFEFVLGGKLPGIFGGVGDLSYRCSGGRKDDRCKCFSLRLMWRYIFSSNVIESPFDAQVLHFPPEAQGKERFTRTSRSMKPTRIDYWRSRLNLTKTQITVSPSEEGLSSFQEALG